MVQSKVSKWDALYKNTIWIKNHTETDYKPDWSELKSEPKFIKKYNWSQLKTVDMN